MLKIRLQRIGRKNDPSFRIVVTDSRKGPKSGKYIELLGSYNPRQNFLNIKGERVSHWISNGAQVSGTVHNILIKEGIIQGKKINVLPKKSPVVKEEGKPASIDSRLDSVNPRQTSQGEEDATEIVEEKTEEEVKTQVTEEKKEGAPAEEPKDLPVQTGEEKTAEEKPESTPIEEKKEEK